MTGVVVFVAILVIWGVVVRLAYNAAARAAVCDEDCDDGGCCEPLCLSARDDLTDEPGQLP
jgi:hypothetical protein